MGEPQAAGLVRCLGAQPRAYVFWSRLPTVGEPLCGGRGLLPPPPLGSWLRTHPHMFGRLLGGSRRLAASTGHLLGFPVGAHSSPGFPEYYDGWPCESPGTGLWAQGAVWVLLGPATCVGMLWGGKCWGGRRLCSPRTLQRGALGPTATTPPRRDSQHTLGHTLATKALASQAQPGALLGAWCD